MSCGSQCRSSRGGRKVRRNATANKDVGGAERSLLDLRARCWQEEAWGATPPPSAEEGEAGVHGGKTKESVGELSQSLHCDQHSSFVFSTVVG
ncbi:hypothetical protein C4D60_Mb01t11780 [Musa balbisiana]|uniref:Uncharacterized protein n=1 Tax=Musa balbisiana TaxID=52838 RepID=A0A4S8JLT3_MUSBA|nr:hypothetical protein C4D60_Mb01t11780 [Musa balbisiana]